MENLRAEKIGELSLDELINIVHLDENENYNKIIRYVAEFVGDMVSIHLSHQEIQNVLNQTVKKTIDKKIEQIDQANDKFEKNIKFYGDKKNG